MNVDKNVLEKFKKANILKYKAIIPLFLDPLLAFVEASNTYRIQNIFKLVHEILHKNINYINIECMIR